LRDADLSHTDLTDATLIDVDFSGAVLNGDQQLRFAHMLRGSIMPDGSRYDGCYALPGDLALAETLGFDGHSEARLKDYYGV